jgi:hypothetical protein
MQSPATDLTDSEWASLDESLLLPPLSVDTSWLDGYLAGLALQIDPPEWSRWAPEALVSCQGSNAACSLALKPDGVVASRRHSPSYDSSSRLAACRTWGVESENQPQRGQFLPGLQAHSLAMGQKDGEKWGAAADLQPTTPKSDRLLASGLDGGAIKRHLSPDTTPVSAQISPATQGLIERRLAALRQALSDKAWWDPYLRAPQTELQDNSPELITHVLMPWVAGFEQALEAFPLVAVNDHDELAAMLVQARIYRHLPALDEQEREVADLLNQTFPLESLEDAVDELTACLAELWDLTRGTTAPQSD